MMTKPTGLRLGKRIAPPRFVLFLAVAIVGSAIAIPALGWRIGGMAAFDAAAAIFLIAVYPLLGAEPDRMRQASKDNDANRALLLAITSIVSIAVLVAVASELSQGSAPKPPIVALIIGTLAMAWLFSNVVYALHYAHLFYSDTDGDGEDEGGIEFPKTEEPDYWDFLYFSICLGMTFQTSDVSISSRRVRKVVTAHCLAAFVFNLGIIAFTINVLGS